MYCYNVLFYVQLLMVFEYDRKFNFEINTHIFNIKIY